MIEKEISPLSKFFHEIKTPINGIINLTKLIEFSLNEMDKEKTKSYLSLLFSQAVYMKNLINNYLEFGKIKSDKQDLLLEEFDIIELLYEIYELTKIMVADRPVKIHINLCPSVKSFPIYSDPLKLKQVLLNITSNSAKFTEKGYITLNLVIKKEHIAIIVTDTGKGIKNMDSINLFQPFCSVDFFTKKFDSTGLGLYITKNLLNILNGDILIESEYGKGTKVIITIPKKYKK